MIAELPDDDPRGGPKRPKRSPKAAKEAPKTAEEAPGTPPKNNGQRGPQGGPKTAHGTWQSLTDAQRRFGGGSVDLKRYIKARWANSQYKGIMHRVEHADGPRARRFFRTCDIYRAPRLHRRVPPKTCSKTCEISKTKTSDTYIFSDQFGAL